MAYFPTNNPASKRAYQSFNLASEIEDPSLRKAALQKQQQQQAERNLFINKLETCSRTLRLYKQFEEYVRYNGHPDSPTFYEKHVRLRCGYLILFLLSTINHVALTVVGVGAEIARITTGGTHTKINELAAYVLKWHPPIMHPYGDLLHSLNPNAEIDNMYSNKDPYSIEDDSYHNSNNYIDSNTFYMSKKLNRFFNNCLNSHNLFNRHISSRLSGVLLIMTHTIECIITIAIGAIAAALSFLTLGTVTPLNSFALRMLKAPTIHRLADWTILTIIGKKNTSP